MPYYHSDSKPASDRRFRLKYRRMKDMAVCVYDTFEWLIARSGCLLFGSGGEKSLFDGETDGFGTEYVSLSKKRYLFEKHNLKIMVHSFDADGIKGVIFTLPASYIIYTDEPQDDFTFHFCMDELKSFGEGLFRYVKAAGDPLMAYSTRVRCPSDADAVLFESAGAVHKELIKILRLNTDGIINGYDSEFLHDFRVSVRRVRSAMSMLKGVYEDTKEAELKQFLRMLGGYTGRARDLDVYLEELDDYDSLLPEAMVDKLVPVKEHFKAERDESYEKLKTFLTSEVYIAGLYGWERLISSRAYIGRKGFVNTKKAARRALNKIFCLADGMTEAISGETPDGQIHEVRIAFKKLRYCIEFFSGFIKEENTADVLARLRDLQDCLGRYNDLSVQCCHMQERLIREKDAETLTVCGYLLGVLTQKKAQERAHAQELIRIFRKDRKRVKKLLGI